MRYVFLVILMLFVMIGLITWATRPDMLETQYNRVVAPIEKHFAEKRAATWQAAKELAWQQWLAQAHLSGECAQAASSLRTLECKNELQMQENYFERDWANRIASGWRPEGMD